MREILTIRARETIKMTAILLPLKRFLTRRHIQTLMQPNKIAWSIKPAIRIRLVRSPVITIVRIKTRTTLSFNICLNPEKTKKESKRKEKMRRRNTQEMLKKPTNTT